MTCPRIYWCWPEIFTESEPVRRQLLALGEVYCSDRLPADGDRVEILVPRLTSPIDAALLTRFPRLKVIATPSTGTDHIDLVAARNRDIVVLSLRQDPEFLKQLQSTAELSWLLILSCVRRAPEAFSQALTGQWNANAVRGRELIRKTLGIIGVGRLGTMVARFANAFGMRVIGTDVRPQDVPGVEFVSMPALLQAADVVSIHVHLDKSTEHLIGPNELALMKRGAVLVNTSRGGVIDESALLGALKSGHLSAAGLDVLTGERSDDFPSHPLIEYARTHENLVLTPHIGGCTEEAQEKAFNHLVGQIATFWSGISAAQLAK